MKPTDYIQPIDETPRSSLIAAARLFLSLYGTFGAGGQIMLQRKTSVPADDTRRFTDGCGSLPDNVSAAAFNEVNPEAEWVTPLLREVEAHSGLNACRARIMTLLPKACLSYHKDTEIWRYHVPCITHTSALFIVENMVGAMPVTGGLYRLRTDLLHTALNAHKTQPRTHIVICVA